MKIRVALVFGGKSVEHEVAVISALQAYMSMDKEKYEVIPFYISKSGITYTGEKLLDIKNFKDIPGLISQCLEASMVRNGDTVEIAAFRRKHGKMKIVDCRPVDIAFPVVHGTFCEDGTVAGFLELMGVPYVGCDVVSAANGMDKFFFKNICREAGIPVLDCITFTSREWVNEREAVTEKIKKIGYPVIVKPVNLGSSVGISVISSPEELDEKISLAASFCDRLLIERAIKSLREINCSVLGDGEECEASVLEEPVMHDEILSYADKYQSSSSSKGMQGLSRKIPANLCDKKTAEIKKYAVNTFKALGACGVARIDFILDTDDNDRVYVNEINTIPGSLSFYLWEPAGVKYSALLDRLIKTGFDRERKRKNLMLSYDTNILSSGSFGAKGAKK